MVKKLLSIAVMVATLSCGPNPDDVPFVRTTKTANDAQEEVQTDVVEDLGDVGIPDVPVEDWGEGEGGPLTGIFAVEVIISANVVIDVETRQLYRLRIHQEGTLLRQRTTLCRLSLPVVEGVAELTIPPATEAVIRTKADEREGDYLSRAEPLAGADYLPEAGTIVVGASLTDPETDPLPTPQDLTTASDEDDDGQPGVTVAATALVCEEQEELYVALRVAAPLVGTVEDENTITGTVSPELEQSVLGYSDACLAAAAQLPIEIRDGSSFRAVRMETATDLDRNGNMSCEEIVLAAPSLFGEYWTDD